MAASASGPAADGALFAFQRPGAIGYLRRADATVALPGRDPALAAGLVGWRDGARIVLADPATLAPVAAYDAPGGGAFAFSDRWVVWLVGTTALVAQPRDGTAAPRVVASARGSERLGRPGLAGQALVFHRAGRRRIADQAARPRHGPGAPAALRAPRAALQPDLRRPRAALRPLHLHPPGAASRPAPPPRDQARPPPLRHHADRPPRRGARARPSPSRRGLPRRPPAPARPPPARRDHRHAVDDGARSGDGVRDPAAAAGRGDERDGAERAAVAVAGERQLRWVGKRGSRPLRSDDVWPLSERRPAAARVDRRSAR